MFANNKSVNTLIVTAMGIASFAGIAQAAPVDENTRSVSIRTDGLDLASNMGARTLDQRVRNAVGQVCGTADGRDLAARAQIAACRKVAMTNATPQVALALANARSDERLALNGASTIRVTAH